MDAAAASGDWRSQLQPDARFRIVNKIMDTLKRQFPLTGPENVDELRKAAVRFEGKTFTAAVSQTDYLKRISMKMLAMESRTQNPGINNQMPSNPGNQNPPDPGSFMAQEDNHPTSQSYQQDVSDDIEIDLNLNMSDKELENDASHSITQQTTMQKNDMNDEATSHSNDTHGASSSSHKRKCNLQFSAEAFDRLLELGEERLKLTRELVENQRKTMSPQVDVALQELLKVEGIPQHYLYKAINLLKDGDDRCIFLALPNEMRLGWILSRLE